MTIEESESELIKEIHQSGTLEQLKKLFNLSEHDKRDMVSTAQSMGVDSAISLYL